MAIESLRTSTWSLVQSSMVKLFLLYVSHADDFDSQRHLHFRNMCPYLPVYAGAVHTVK